MFFLFFTGETRINGLNYPFFYPPKNLFATLLIRKIPTFIIFILDIGTAAVDTFRTSDLRNYQVNNTI